MKKSFLKRIVVLLVVLVMAGGAVFANPKPVELKITGKVAAISSLSLDSTNAELKINPVTGFKQESISTGKYCSNNLNGFFITVHSANKGLRDTAVHVVHVSDEATVIPYTVYLNGDTDGVLADGLGGNYKFIESSGPSLTSKTFDIGVSVAPVGSSDPLWAAGKYQDTLTFTLTNN